MLIQQTEINMFEITGLRFMLEQCGVPATKSEKFGNLLEQAMLHGIKGTDFPPYTGFTPEDMRLGTNIAKAISERIAKNGKMKRESELRVGDIVRMSDIPGSGWNTMLVLKHDTEKRLLKFSRPYGSLSGAGTTCPSMYVGIENFDAPYNEKLEWQSQYLVVARDTSSLMNDAHSTIRCVDRKRLNAHINVMRTALGLEAWEDDRIAKMEWVDLQQEAMGLANKLIEKELDVPYPE
jgi:hypothetical protein